MAEDWAPNDLAICIRSFEIPPSRARIIKRGEILQVRLVGECDRWSGPGLTGLHPVLWFHGIGTDDRLGWSYYAMRFRKINPFTDEEQREALEDLRIPSKVMA